MTRESRILLTLVVMSGIGVGGLMLVANQYRKAIASTAGGTAGGEDPTARAVRHVDGYLAARAASQAVVRSHPGTIGTDAGVAGTYRLERSNALAAHGMTYENYAEVRAAWRAFSGGGFVDDLALIEVLRARRAQLEAAGLGPVEALDDAIK
jgi:hypothetical protein